MNTDFHCVDKRPGVDGNMVADKGLGAEKRRIVSKADGSALTVRSPPILVAANNFPLGKIYLYNKPFWL
jgi:hypothetical protein